MKTIYKGDSRYEKIYEQMQLLGIQDVSSPRQVKNGTIVWRLPIKGRGNTHIEYASFATGYVRNQGNQCHSNWQINKCKIGKREYKFPNGKVYEYDTKERVLIPIEIDRLEYMMKYIIKNDFIKRANYIQEGKFVPRWKYERALENRDAIADIIFPEKTQSVQVIIDGHKYNVI